MLDSKSLLVLNYLKNHFKNSSEPIIDMDISIIGLGPTDISKAIYDLNKAGYIDIDKSIHPSVLKLNN